MLLLMSLALRAGHMEHVHSLGMEWKEALKCHDEMIKSEEEFSIQNSREKFVKER